MGHSFPYFNQHSCCQLMFMIPTSLAGPALPDLPSHDLKSWAMIAMARQAVRSLADRSVAVVVNTKYTYITYVYLYVYTVYIYTHTYTHIQKL